MTTFKTKILDILSDIKGAGSFVSNREADFEYPGLQVKGVGEISFPVTEGQVKALINKARKAPFGKGTETILDSSVRSGWEIDAAELKFTGDGWKNFLTDVLNQIKRDLGISEYTISANLYKMLIYEKGDFFLTHKDSEKEKGMFGTLIIALPSKHSGGELLVRFDGKEECIDFSTGAGNFKMPFAAFYADCEHEVKPVISGYRINLVYNLIQKNRGNSIKIEPQTGIVKRLANLLQQEEYNPEKSAKVILLGHQYTPENFSLDSLKLNDRSKAEALQQAADKAGYYSKMALVTSYVAGTPMYDDYYDEGGYDEDSEMEDVYDESLSIDHWMDEGVPSLEINFDKEDLIASFHLEDDEPIIKEMEGYMGNYGPDLMHWYHYGAVILWPKEHHTELLLRQDTKTKLAWIAYYNSLENNLTDVELSALDAVLLSNFGTQEWEKPDYTSIVVRLINKKDERYFTDTGSKLVEQHFVKMDTKQLARLAEAYPKPFTEVVTKIMINQPKVSVFEHFLLFLNALSSNTGLDVWKANQMKVLPEILQTVMENNQQKPVLNKNIWSTILELEKKQPQSQRWVEETAKLITAFRDRNYINDVLIAEVMTIEQNTPLSDAVLRICKEDLEQRVYNKPRPPKNWSRAIPDTKNNAKQWAILAPFMHSPDQRVFDYKKRQNERNEMEYAIRNVTVDLMMETIRRGSPHTLRISKTETSYHRQMEKWNEDVALLEKVKKKISQKQ